MSPNLPPILPTRTSNPALSGSSGPTLHAQDLSVLKLQQKKDIESARVSSNQVMSGSGYNKTTTSISRLSDQENTVDGSNNDSEINDRRYDYAQRAIKQRQAKERANESVKSDKKDDTFKVGIGKGYRTTGRMSFDRRLGKLMREKRATYRNISKDDKKVFSGIVKSTLKGKPVGSEVTRLNRLKMKMKIERERTSRGGKFSSEDVKDFKGLVEKLK